MESGFVTTCLTQAFLTPDVFKQKTIFSLLKKSQTTFDYDVVFFYRDVNCLSILYLLEQDHNRRYYQSYQEFFSSPTKFKYIHIEKNYAANAYLNAEREKFSFTETSNQNKKKFLWWFHITHDFYQVVIILATTRESTTAAQMPSMKMLALLLCT